MDAGGESPVCILSVGPRWATGPADSQTKFNEKLGVLASYYQKPNTFATTLSEQQNLTGTREAKNAANASVTLVGAMRSLGCQEKPCDAWLTVTPHCFYRHLPKTTQHMDLIIAHAPYYAWGAMNIQEAFYPDSKLVLINHSFPVNPSKIAVKDMKAWAEMANLVISLDKETFDKYEHLYGKESHIEHRLVEIPKLSLDTLMGTTPDLDDSIQVRGTNKAPLDNMDGPDVTEKPPPDQKEVAEPTMASLTAGMSKLSVNSDWHKGFTPTLRKFHDDHARYPTEATKKAMPYFEGTMKKVEGKLRERDLCVRFEFTGSAYEGVMINENDIEFDLMVIMSGGNDLETELFDDGTGGYFLLKPSPEHHSSYAKLLHSPDNQVISPDKVVNVFFGALQKTLNETGDTGKTKLRKHGPAVQMDVYHDVNKTQKWFSVDIVPAYQVRTPGSVQLFVAKPYRSATASNQSWRKSFSVEEKQKFKVIDKGDGCRRMCIRILKAIRKPPDSIKRKPDSSFSHITSFMLKNTLFHENEDTSLDWGMKKLAPRCMQLIERLARYLQQGYFPHYFLPGVNIVAGLEDGPRRNLADRLEHLVNSEVEFRKIIGAE